MYELISVLIVLSFLGLFDSAYLVWKHYSKEPLLCPINSSGCSKVTESKWSNIFGVRNDALGFIYYMIVLIGAISIYAGYELKVYLLAISIIAFLFSLFLIYVQKYVIKEYCFYCLISSLINLLIFFVLVMIK